MRSILLIVVLSCALASASTAQRLERIQPCVLVGARLENSPDSPTATLVLRDGRIAGILQDDSLAPAGVRRIDARDLLVVPAFIDACTHAGCEGAPAREDADRPPSPASDVLVEMRAAHRKGLDPAYEAVAHFALSDSELASRRAQGFAALHVVPDGNLLGGRGVTLTTRQAALRERVVRAGAFQSATFSARGDGYPSTQMGYLAHLRQFFLDAGRHAVLLERRDAGELNLRPPYDPDLVAARELLAGRERLLCLADASRDIERWMAFAGEIGVPLVVAGGREAWRVADLLVANKVDVILSLDWGKEVPDPDAEAASEEEPEAAGAQPEPPATYLEPIEVRRERRRLWLEGRDCALRLHAAGVRFAFGSRDASPKELVGKVRKLVEAGLPASVAMRSLTATAAEILGVGRHLGRIEVGFDADLALWTGPPTEAGSRLRWLIVDGVVHEFPAEGDEQAEEGAPDAGVDASGVWALEFDSEAARPAQLTLEMQASGAVSGSFETTSPIDGAEIRGAVAGHVQGRALRLEGGLTIGGFEVELELRGRIAEDGMTGEVTWTASSGEQRSTFEASRKPERRWEGQR